MPAEMRGFCLSSAASKVEPERGRPEMKWRRFCTGGGHPERDARL